MAPTRRTSSSAARSTPPKAKPTANAVAMAPVVAPGSPSQFRARVRMYRHGLGDCFLVTFPRKGQRPLQMLIDCGALARNKADISRVVEHIRDTVRDGAPGKARLDVVVGTHEHKDHLSGFNQAREIFNADFEFGSVWLAWTENLGSRDASAMKETKKKALETLQGFVSATQFKSFAGDLTVASLPSLLSFSQADDTTGAGRVSEAMAYLKLRGEQAGDIRYLEPGGEPFELDGVDGVRVYVLGPPRDPSWLSTSRVTEAMKRDHVVYHLGTTGLTGMDALGAALGSGLGAHDDGYHPFSAEHRISNQVQDAVSGVIRPHPYYELISGFLSQTYDDPSQSWRRIDNDWLGAFGQLALDLDSDTNNTSLVLAFEFKKTGEVLLFVADAQIGSWLSWNELEFKLPEGNHTVSAQDLLNRTVFYKVGHHCSHNATAKAAGLELMTRDDLVAFIPLDKTTARNMGASGWNMPADALFKALGKRAGKRVVISDVNEKPPEEALAAGVVATQSYVDFFLE